MSKQVEFGGASPPSPPVVTSVWDTAIAYGNNWYYVDWFGYFYKVDGNPWIFHSQFGWFYTDLTTSFDSVWLYHGTFGWVWTNKDCFSYFFNAHTSTWFYVVDGGYYNYDLNMWVASDFSIQ